MIQYIAVPVSTGGYTLHNTHARIFTMVEVKSVDTEGPGIGSSKGYTTVSRHISQYDITVAGTLADAATGTYLAIVNKNGHVTPISDPTP